MGLLALFKRKPPASAPQPPQLTLPPDVLPIYGDELGFPRPDWRHFQGWLAGQPLAEQAAWYGAANHHWLSEWQALAGGSMAIASSPRFLLFYPQGLPERTSAYFDVLESLTTRLLQLLPGLAEPPSGQMSVLVFGSPADYHDYSAYYYPDFGAYGLSGGMFLYEGAGHIALPYHGFHVVEPVLAHELTHAMLRKRRLPRWLDEGLAVTFEQLCYPVRPQQTPFEQQRSHQALWTAETIQRFWSGESFSAPDEYQSHSYELAQVLVGGLSRERARFLAFAGDARRADAGASACQTHLGVSLSEAVAAYLGEGDWGPRTASN
ncbi:hypothetical protein SAMN02745857_03754 [Andreprevotia lacus DSM 23236]|jgi:hypothetical protein|uniref:Peptidase MA superfamily protein n=1 Tax=Andreprevotia lacus DSM 23236 TaxID=1121001 RepID=A0A1W1Y0M6_9NEIS|nr:hypothetical protein [Andreprevotia lacus]SMC29308.1 hypothetical protein SAMN02745857_03754 [Andreprevotia lacus DSM 23236]